MKGKALLSLAIVLSMLLAAIPIFPASASPTSIEVIFQDTGTSTLKGPPPGIGDHFMVTLHVTDVPKPPGCVQWMVKIRWNPSVLNLASDPTEGPWLKSAGSTWFMFKAYNASHLPEMTCILSVVGAAEGSGDLAYLEFKVLNIGSSLIEIYGSSLVTPEGTYIDHTIVNGNFELPPPPPTPPEAIFKPPTCTFVYVGDTVTCVGTASTGGWDTVPTAGEYCPIQSYSWEIDFGNDGSIELYLDGETAVFTCEGPGDVAITLIVYAPDPTAPNTHPDYAPYNDPAYRDAHNTETHIIHQILKPVGPSIDVYTARGGIGPGIDPATGLPYPYPTAWSDAYGPQEQVVIHAKVTYNDEPVEYKPVAFEIIDLNGQQRDYRVAYTDASGIATTEFRIPWEGSNAEALFGDWTIIGTVSISEQTVMDICKFRFGYILSIRGVTVSPSALKKCMNLGVTVDIQNIARASKDTYLTITLYDECGVPIGVTYGVTTVDPEDGLVIAPTLHIPMWAFVGTGTVYVNLFTAEPQFGGVPYCPEGTAIFTILKTLP